jgi:hypothetical protein
MPNIRFDANEMLQRACVKHEIELCVLIAETALWAHPDTHRRQLETHGAPAVFPHIRRLRSGEKRGLVNGERLDDNSYANMAIKRFLGADRSEIVGFECCHIWPDTCYDPRYHTAIPNLVLLPRALASLSDHHLQVSACLQFRAYQLYGWHPIEHPIPEKPATYPDCWRAPEQDPRGQALFPVTPPDSQDPPGGDSDDSPVSIEKILRWANKPRSNVHRIIAIVHHHGAMSREELVRQIDHFDISDNAYGAVASLMTNAGAAYGRVFVVRAGLVCFHPEIEPTIRQCGWRAQ